MTKLLVLVALLVPVAGLQAPAARACDWPNYYDPSHQVCAPSQPTYPQPGYDQHCDGDNYYDPAHQICAPYPPVYLPPFYPTS